MVGPRGWGPKTQKGGGPEGWGARRVGNAEGWGGSEGRVAHVGNAVFLERNSLKNGRRNCDELQPCHSYHQMEDDHQICLCGCCCCDCDCRCRCGCCCEGRAHTLMAKFNIRMIFLCKSVHVYTDLFRPSNVSLRFALGVVIQEPVADIFSSELSRKLFELCDHALVLVCARNVVHEEAFPYKGLVRLSYLSCVNRLTWSRTSRSA